MKLKLSPIFLSFVIVVLLVASMVQTAGADQPTRQFQPLPPSFTLSGVCSFDVNVDVLMNNVYATMLVDSAGNPRAILTSGALKLRLTNATSGKSIDLNISGPGRLYPNADGTSTLITQGPWLIFLAPGQLPLYTPRMFFITGQSVLTFDAAGNNSQITINGGNVVDLCAALQ